MDLSILNDIDLSQLTDDYILPWGINIVMALIIFFIGKFFIKILVNIAKKLMLRVNLDDMLINFVSSILKAILLLFVIVASLNQLGVDTSSLIALIAAAGLAIGLALQSSLRNLASGLMLIIFRPFNNGDLIEVAGVIGIVQKITMFTTVLCTVDNREIIVPNGEIFDSSIVNLSKNPTRRVDMVFGIGYDDDIKKAKDIILDILVADERVLDDPKPVVVVGELADSSVNFNVRPWCKKEDYWSVYFDTHEKVKLMFDANGVTIPYPQMDIHQDVLDKTA